MHWIAQANVDRFHLLLETETDSTKRAMIVRLLAEEELRMRYKAKAPGPAHGSCSS